jgi:hypothetical protein
MTWIGFIAGVILAICVIAVVLALSVCWVTGRASERERNDYPNILL